MLGEVSYIKWMPSVGINKQTVLSIIIYNILIYLYLFHDHEEQDVCAEGEVEEHPVTALELKWEFI